MSRTKVESKKDPSEIFVLNNVFYLETCLVIYIHAFRNLITSTLWHVYGTVIVFARMLRKVLLCRNFSLECFIFPRFKLKRELNH